MQQRFIDACKNGDLKIAKRLLSLPNNNININAYNDYAFRLSCCECQLEVAKWLVSLENNNIDINAINDQVFRYACYNGHLEVAKWLLSLPNNNININAENDIDINAVNDAFYMSCLYRNGHLELAKWLLTLPSKKPIDITKQIMYSQKELATLETHPMYKWADQYKKDIRWQNRKKIILWRTFRRREVGLGR